MLEESQPGPLTVGGTSEEYLVALRDVGYRYPLPDGKGQRALEDISLRIGRREKLVVLGASGSGKTTLACLLAGLFEPSAGRIERCATLENRSGRFLPVGLVTQNPEDTFTSPVVREEMGMVLQNLAWEDEDIDGAVDAMLRETGLEEYSDSPPALLSGGQKQLLALSSIFIADPRLVILDEPLSLLDSGGREEVSSLLSRRGETGAGSFVLLSSEVEDALKGDRAAVLSRGRLVWEGAVGDLPLEGDALPEWGLEIPDLSRLSSLLLPGHRRERNRLWRSGELADFLCRYD
jgi:energy-coupling factor transport system ATP-binding protein